MWKRKAYGSIPSKVSSSVGCGRLVGSERTVGVGGLMGGERFIFLQKRHTCIIRNGKLMDDERSVGVGGFWKVRGLYVKFMGRSTSVGGQCKHCIQKILAKFSFPQKPRDQKFRTQRNILWSSPSLEIRSTLRLLPRALTIAVYSCLTNYTKFYYYYQFIISKALSPSTLQASY